MSTASIFRAGLTLAAACCVLAAAASAQERHRMQLYWINGDVAVEAQLDGRIEFTDDYRDVRSLGTDGRFALQERRSGEPTRRIEFRGRGDGTVERRYFEDGRLTAEDAEARAWVGRILFETVRNQGIDADRRVRRILDTQGVDGVLAEIAEIEGSGGRRAYYTELFRQARLRPGQAARALDGLARDTDSDGDQARLLRLVLPQLELASAPVRDAFFSATTEIDSDGDQRLVLRSALERAAGIDGALVAWLRSAAEIDSDGDKSSLLVMAARLNRFASDAVREAFFAAARSIDSDGDKARVLLAVPAESLRDERTSAAYVAAARTIDSDGDQERALTHAVWSRP